MNEPLFTERDAEPKKSQPDDAEGEEEENAAPVTRSDARAPTPRPGNDAGPAPSDDQEPPPADGPTDPDEPPPDDVPPDDGEPMQSEIAGSALAAKCSTYGKRTEQMCAGVFCGVTLAQIEAELDPAATCAVTAEQICAGKMPTTTALCARQIKSDPFNALDSDAMLRTKIRDCIYTTEPSIKENASPKCTDCFLDAALCSSTHCVAQCLTGDSAECDKCRDANDCTQPVFGCAGVPNPF
ncbi:MAG: hypothetical protein ABW352_04050 [Polyangiales bacterium]